MPLGLVAAPIGVMTGVGVIVGLKSGRPVLGAALAGLVLIVSGFGVMKLLGF